MSKTWVSPCRLSRRLYEDCTQTVALTEDLTWRRRSAGGGWRQCWRRGLGACGRWRRYGRCGLATGERLCSYKDDMHTLPTDRHAPRTKSPGSVARRQAWPSLDGIMCTHCFSAGKSWPATETASKATHHHPFQRARWSTLARHHASPLQSLKELQGLLDLLPFSHALIKAL